MSKGFKCDICGEFYDPYPGLNTLQLSEKNANGKWGKSKTSFDVCPDCLDKVVTECLHTNWDYIQGRMEVQSATETTQKC